MKPLLTVQDLSLSFPSRLRGEPPKKVLEGVSFILKKEKLAVVGESGSGKTMLARTILGLQPPACVVTAQKLMYKEKNLLTLDARGFQRLRGREMTFILQDPKYALNPNITVGEQIAEMYIYHEKMTPKEAYEATLEALSRVQIKNPKRVYQSYPHENSGGMGQRAMIAMMLAARPQLLIADEPTSALDKDNQKKFLELVDSLIYENEMALLLISHDLPLVQGFCDRLMILYQGQVMEILDSQDLHKSVHPYTRGLLQCLPSTSRRIARLPTLDRSLL